MGDVKLVDSMMLDGLIDAFHDYHMGITGTKNGQRYKWDIRIFHMEDKLHFVLQKKKHRMLKA